MKQKTFLFAALVAAFLSVASFSAAQVTIGGSTEPQKGAILDLNSTTKGGLLLSHIYLDKLTHIPAGQLVDITGEQDVNTDLTGIVVYNTNALLKLEVSQTNSIDMPGRGIYVWDGNKWNKIGAPEHAITFAPYNLGANVEKLNTDYPNLSAAKQQMAYLANNAFNKLDACVYGGFFQWGRKDLEHAVNISNYTRYNGTENAVSGQSAIIPTDGKFYYGNTQWYTGTSPAKNSLWGNGVAIGTAIAGGVYSSDGSYYQKPVKTQYDPCPDGWRVPTQDEFERLTDYGYGTPQTAGGNISTTVSGHGAINSGLTWIPVVCSSGKCIPSNSWTDGTTSSGYAVYKASVWTAAKAAGNVYDGLTDGNVATIFTGKSLHDDDAPEPLLFLPAAGYRHCIGSDIRQVGFYGFYWNSTASVYGTQIFSNGVQTTSANLDLGHGFSVRCVKSL
ncbi:MAG: fibrobacter succinogenes major paralogous domain-containing protein [Prevotellaceae bacterium]|nr:fibrobacter succinogenes major paralogous domain-containing protein [Prevotellaceae bacterium]